MIRDLADGEVVPGEGAYRCSMAHYHGQAICPGPSVSSTGIRKAENESPWAFWSTFAGNPDAYPPKDSDQFAFGRAAHCLILGDEVFSESYVIMPFDSLRTKEARAWKEEQIAAGKTVITADQLEDIRRMADNLSKVPLVQAGILAGEPEVSLIWQDEPTQIWVKSRPDVIQLNGQVVADLKTCASASLIDCQRSITKYGYDMQFALAIEGIERIFGVTATDAVVIFAEKSAPYHVRSMPIDADTLYWARMRVRRGLDKIAGCFDRPPLPIFEDDETPYSLPASLQERMENEQSDGLLPNIGNAA